MKPTKILRWMLLGSLGTIAACGGVSDIGNGDEDPMGKAGKGTMAVGGSSPGTGAKGMGAENGVGAGTSVAGKGTMAVGGGTAVDCEQDQDCKVSNPFCEMCEEGNYVCSTAFCAGGKCLESRDTCKGKCATDKDCPPPSMDIACTDCGDGTQACPISQCLMGECQPYLLGCGEINPCEKQACGTECKVCTADGMCENKVGYCSGEGQCLPGLPQCAEPGECKTSMDCGDAPPKCVPCGNDTCAGFDCIQGKCAFTCPPNPNPQCKTSDECVSATDDCKLCPNGKCAVGACIKDSCQLVCPL